jgi:hypothetical protein
MKTSRPKRILALDVHPLSIGFAVLEGPDRLLDWGVRSFRHGVNAVKVPMSRKLACLIDEYQPDALLVKGTPNGTARRVKMIAKVAAMHHLPVRAVSGDSIKRAFPQSTQNKHQMAQAVADHFPLLSSYVPPKRKP